MDEANGTAYLVTVKTQEKGQRPQILLLSEHNLLRKGQGELGQLFLPRLHRNRWFLVSRG